MANGSVDKGFEQGRPVVLRNGTVVTMDSRKTVLTGADVLIREGRIEAVPDPS